jgi:hypothetical protein
MKWKQPVLAGALIIMRQLTEQGAFAPLLNKLNPSFQAIYFSLQESVDLWHNHGNVKHVTVVIIPYELKLMCVVYKQPVPVAARSKAWVCCR